MMLVQTHLRNSDIEGVGIFAAQFIPKGTAIWQLNDACDVTFTDEQVAKLPPQMRDFLDRYGFPHMEKDGLMIIEMDHGRFMNHSMKPNTDFTRPDVGYAIADIHPGEELLCNYYEFDRTFRGFGEQEPVKVKVEPKKKKAVRVAA